MLRLVRRPLADFLREDLQAALAKRAASAHELAITQGLTDADKTRHIRQRWDDFRRGRTGQGTFTALWVELLGMSFLKCAFCETPAPGTVEHIEALASTPHRAFDWDNLLAACDACNRGRANSGIVTAPFDPSREDPLDSFGWDLYGDFAAAPEHTARVQALVVMYGLHRFREERRLVIDVVRALLVALIGEDATNPDTVDTLRNLLSETKAWLGPVREYLLRPPSERDALLVRGALLLRPDLRTWVAPWLRPPTWAPPWWR